MKQIFKWKCGSHGVMQLRSSFKKKLQPSCGKEGNQKAFSAFKVALCYIKSLCLRSLFFPGSSHHAADQDGDRKVQPFCPYLRQTLTSNVPPKIPSRLPEALWGLYHNLIYCFAILLFRPSSHMDWSLINTLYLTLSQW